MHRFTRTSLAALALLALAAPAAAQRRPRRPADASVPAAPADASAPAADDPVARFDALLHDVVHGSGVNYAAVRGRLDELRAFHEWLATHGPATTPEAFPTADARKAYWLNAYNASVLRGVAEAPAAMTNVLTYLPNNGFFRARRWRLDGRERTLDDVENHDVREVFHDARVHMALNCGARSCPPLRANVYRADRVDAQLDDQARRFVNAAGNVTVDAAAHTVRVVQLFEWFRDDFAARVPGHPASPLAGAVGFLHTFAAAPLRAQLEAACGADGGACALTFTPYEWTLNNTPMVAR